MAVTKERVREQLLGLRQLHGTAEKELTQEDAARRVDTSARNWQRWENMEVMPGLDKLGDIAEAFDIPLDVFDDGKEDRAGRPLVERLDDIERKLDKVIERLSDDESGGVPDRLPPEPDRPLEPPAGDEPETDEEGRSRTA